MLKFFNPFLILLLSLFTSTSHAQDTIHWRPNYRVTWSDFKGKPDSLSKMSALTYTGTGTVFTPTDEGFKFDVTCYFVRTNSWSRSDSPQLLEHERTHFDIAELFARKLRKELSELKYNFATFDADIKEIHSRLETEKRKMNIDYDNQTKFSMDAVMQKDWSNRIIKEIKTLDKYAR